MNTKVPANDQKNSQIPMERIGFFASDLSAEMRLLLACLRLSPDHDDLEQIRKLSWQNVNWKNFIKLTAHHKVSPLVYNNLKRTGTLPGAENVLDKFQFEFDRNAYRSMTLTRELVRLLKLMRTNAVAMIPFKGPVLAQELYGNLALRRAGDLDVLVDKDAVDRADYLLRGLGYRRLQPESTLTRRQRIQFEFRNHHFAYFF
jgi:hypothetical protein